MSPRYLLAMAAFATVASGAVFKSQPLVIGLTAGDGQDAGTATLSPVRGGVRFKLDLRNLPEGEHSLDIHQVGKCDAPDFASAGARFNPGGPGGKEQGSASPKGAVTGELPVKLEILPDGTEHLLFTAQSVSLRKNAPNSLFANGGTSIVIHARADDKRADPSGAGGDRIACGVIVPQ